MLTQALMWIGWIAVILVYIVLVYIAWRALFADRSKGRRRCPRCWFDMAYSPGMTCSECGHTVGHEKRFYRTRRRYKRAMLAISGCVAIVLAGNVWMAEMGWLSFMPNRVVIASLQFSSSPNGGARAELLRRMRDDALTEGDWKALVRRCAGGDVVARPPSPEWELKYGSMLASWRRALRDQRDPDHPDTPTELEGIMLEIPAEVSMRSRAAWPIGVDPVIRVRVRDWWPVGTSCRVHITPRVEGGETLTLHRSSTRPPWSDYPYVMPAALIEGTRVDFDIVTERRAVNEDDWTEVSQTVVQVPIRQSGTIAEAMTPDEDDLLTDAVKRTFAAGMVKWTSGESPLRTYFNARHMYTTQYDDLACGVHVDILFEGRLARRLDIWWHAGESHRQDPATGFDVAAEDAALLAQATGDDPRWTVRVTSDASLALRAGNALRFWQGEFEMPLRLNVIDEPAPETRWWEEVVGDDDE